MTSPTITIDFGITRIKVAHFDKEKGEARLIELGHDVRTIVPLLFHVTLEGDTFQVGRKPRKTARKGSDGFEAQIDTGAWAPPFTI